MELKLLGTGSAGGVPLYGCLCKACQKARDNSVFKRRQCSAEFVAGNLRLLIDAGLSDLPQRYPPSTLTGILLTHYHVDHVEGLFHWRWGKSEMLRVYGPDDKRGCADLLKHPGFFDFSRTLQPFENLYFGSISITAVPLQHSRPVLGYVFDDSVRRIAYLTDTVGLPEETSEYLRQNPVDILVIDCSHPPQKNGQIPRNHNDLPLVLALHQQLKPEQTVLTHISHELDAWLMDNDVLPESMTVGYDNQVYR